MQKKKYSSLKIFWSEMFQGLFVIKGLHQKEVFIKKWTKHAIIHFCATGSSHLGL